MISLIATWAVSGLATEDLIVTLRSGAFKKTENDIEVYFSKL